MTEDMYRCPRHKLSAIHAKYWELTDKFHEYFGTASIVFLISLYAVIMIMVCYAGYLSINRPPDYIKWELQGKPAIIQTETKDK